jgi:putative ABC transport system permease protein
MRPYQLTMGDEAAMRQLTELRAVTGYLGRNDLYQVSAYANTSGQVLGVEPNYSEVRFLPLAEGRFIDASDLAERRRVVVLGSKNALLLSLGHPMLGETITINDITFTVIGRAAPVSHGNNDSENQKIYIPLTTMLELFAMKGDNVAQDALSSIQYQPTKRGDVTAAVAAVHRVIAERHGFDASLTDAFEEWNTIHTQQMIAAIFNGMDVFLGSVGLVTLGLGAVGIINIMLVSVTERTQEIGVMKAVGATRSSILAQFFWEGLLLTGISGLIGVAISEAFMALLQATLTGKMPGWDPPRLVPWSAALAVGSLAICGIVAGLYPARKAAALDPIEALRKE